ncbi:beta-phosphoglucomutase [Vermiculatibacterium agrestimuris]|uniref:beta-phosphoglucomutase n=1 Tax=Vermiculatibacterium agrestimuris TaxID=2941519 RepID=UPI00203AD1BC|nr:beta-phosphoglucomutase [Vermiculatibacterium agrestimuris]
MKKAVIFDLDGVLVHTDRYHYNAWRILTDKLGIDFPQERYDGIRGLSRMDSLERILAFSPRQFTREEKEALAAEKNEAYLQRVEQMGPEEVDGDVRAALRGLREKGLLLAVGSSSKNAKRILARTELTACFDAIADGSMVTRAKPDPEVFLKAAELLRVAPAQALVVEDAAAGLRAAKAGGFQAVAFGGDAAGNPLADYEVTRLTALLELV